MELLKIIFISIVQGITEFLPVSSSGHIFLLKNILNLEMNATFDVVIHTGTLLAVIIFFYKDIKELVSGLFKKKIDSTIFGNNLTRKNYIYVFILFIIATIPGGIIGLLLNDPLDVSPSNTTSWMFLLLAIFFCITALFLLSTHFTAKQNKKNKRITELSPVKALIIGLFQALAIFPGVSRSGSTLTASIYTRLERKDAARFSFILSIPLILAAFILKVLDLIQSPETADIKLLGYLTAGLIVSLITGFISLKLLITMLQKGKLWFFSIYLIIPIAVSVYLWLK